MVYLALSVSKHLKERWGVGLVLKRRVRFENSGIGEDIRIEKKKQFTFGHCPNHLRPPNSGNLVLFWTQNCHKLRVKFSSFIKL